jgi:hypothetical protein
MSEKKIIVFVNEVASLLKADPFHTQKDILNRILHRYLYGQRQYKDVFQSISVEEDDNNFQIRLIETNNNKIGNKDQTNKKDVLCTNDISKHIRLCGNCNLEGNTILLFKMRANKLHFRIYPPEYVQAQMYLLLVQAQNVPYDRVKFVENYQGRESCQFIYPDKNKQNEMVQKLQTTIEEFFLINHICL